VVITLYRVVEEHTCAEQWNGEAVPNDTVWIDLLAPSPSELSLIGPAFSVDAPSDEEMRDIEVSSRLYKEGGATYMVVSVVEQSFTDHPRAGATTLIVAPKHLITVRYNETHAFETFTKRVLRQPAIIANADVAFINLVEAHVDRASDILKHCASCLTPLNKQVFSPRGKKKHKHGATEQHNLRELMRRIGITGNLSGLVHDSLVSIKRTLVFYRDTVQTPSSNALTPRVDIFLRDVDSLTEYANHLQSKVNFLLDATLGLVNAEQNQIIKIFSVVAVVFLPPTLIASIYGMNFQFMPELASHWGYPLALLLMAASAVGPYMLFKHKGWV
jgi:magnesium transporter